MLENNISRTVYFLLNQRLEEQNKEYLYLMSTKEYKIGSFICRLINCIKSRKWRSIRGYFWNFKWNKNVPISNDVNNHKDKREFNEYDYFINERIAVYACVFGKYDQLQEPVIKPDNIDYYIVTDQDIPKGSSWKTVTWENHIKKSFSNVEKNRFFKMHPECLFPEYRYSIYIDGNIKVISDLTPYIKLLGKTGMGFHYHNQRSCTYKELEAIKLAHKVRRKEADNYTNYLKKNHFPQNYGLLECNVIVREHNNPICKKVMLDWWEQFLNRIKRDQVSLPFILYSNGIKIDEVAVLGNNVYSNFSFRIIKHL